MEMNIYLFVGLIVVMIVVLEFLLSEFCGL